MRKYINIINEASSPNLNNNIIIAIEKDLEILFRKIYTTINPKYKDLHVKLFNDISYLRTSDHNKQYNNNLNYRFEIKVPFWEPDWINNPDQGEQISLGIFRRISRSANRGKKHYTRGLSGKIHQIFKKYISDWSPGPIKYYAAIHEFEILSFKNIQSGHRP